MNILLSNDDGIFAPGLWELAKELKKRAKVFIVAPDREQSGVGTGITLHHPLRVQQVKSLYADIRAYAVCGTPGDSVIVGIKHLADFPIDLVISGINAGPNVGDDILLSGTVGAALQGYLHGISSIAVSLDDTGEKYISSTAKITALLVDKIFQGLESHGGQYLLNVNIPACDTAHVKGIKVTQLGFTGLSEEIQEGHDGRKNYYWIKHRKTSRQTDDRSDVYVLSENYISITPLHIYIFQKTAPVLNGNLHLYLETIRTL